MGPNPGFRFRGLGKICGARRAEWLGRGGANGRPLAPQIFVYQMFTIYPLIGVFLGQFRYNGYTPFFIVNSFRCILLLSFLFSPDSPLGAGSRRFESARPDQRRSGTSLNNPPQFPH